MTFQLFIFLVLSVIVLGSATAVVTVRNSVHSALFLVLTFFTTAGIWILLEAEFLAITLVLVYVGAVMVLFLFVVMMLDVNSASKHEGFADLLPIALGVGLIMAVELVLVLSRDYFGVANFPSPISAATDYSNARMLGELLYTEYLFQFEAAAVVLLIAIVAAIGLTMRKRPNSKKQNPSKQVRVTKEQRLKIVKMVSEPKKL